MQRGGDRVKISERLLIEAEIKGRIYHQNCSPNIQKVTKGEKVTLSPRPVKLTEMRPEFLKEISKNWKTRLSRLPKQELFDRNYYN